MSLERNEKYLWQLKGCPFAQNPRKLLLYGSLRGSRKLTATTAQTLQLLFAPFRLDPQRFGDIRSQQPRSTAIFKILDLLLLQKILCVIMLTI
jgi:hypothetical protein